MTPRPHIASPVAHWTAAHSHLTLYASPAYLVRTQGFVSMPVSAQALATIWPIPLPRTLDPIGTGLWCFTYPSTALYLNSQGLHDGCNPFLSSSRLASMSRLPNSFSGSHMPPGQSRAPGPGE